MVLTDKEPSASAIPPALSVVQHQLTLGSKRYNFTQAIDQNRVAVGLGPREVQQNIEEASTAASQAF